VILLDSGVFVIDMKGWNHSLRNDSGLADAKGFYVGDLIRMVESGMSAQHIADTVVSTSPSAFR
jgi:hypothetical protein